MCVEHAAAWKTYSKMGVFGVLGVAAFVVVKHLGGHHEHEFIAYPHLERRKREFPWGTRSLFGQNKVEDLENQ